VTSRWTICITDAAGQKLVSLPHKQANLSSPEKWFVLLEL
jgi:hypothetical protein